MQLNLEKIVWFINRKNKKNLLLHREVIKNCF